MLPDATGAARGLARSSAAISRDNALASARRARRLALDRASPACRPQPRQRARPISLRQWPPGARQAAGRRGARRLRGFPRPRPPSGRGACSSTSTRGGRRQCPSGQGRGALPRRGPGARPDRRRAAARRWRDAGHAPRPRRADAGARAPFRRGWIGGAHVVTATSCAAARVSPRTLRAYRALRRCGAGRIRCAPRRRRTPAPRSTAERDARSSARRRARAAARDLYRGPDRATASSSSTSTPRMSGWSMSA